MFINLKTFALFMGRSPEQILDTLEENPYALPPNCEIPGSDELRWHLFDLIHWCKEQNQ